jgi:hypothetical protein
MWHDVHRQPGSVIRNQRDADGDPGASEHISFGVLLPAVVRESSRDGVRAAQAVMGWNPNVFFQVGTLDKSDRPSSKALFSFI